MKMKIEKEEIRNKMGLNTFAWDSA